ncbi:MULTISPECIES: flippase [Enterobacterales]|nr:MULTISPECIES: flippase [Enterobacterales]EEW2104402.1 flippase [Escherichia coli]EHP6183348.1 flippase [Escherichia coli]EHP6404683.1 flippase [Escherichia coli]EIX5752412.1 flippase [Escherichia coli]MCD1392267.1 flippase [Enterobacter cloacae]
MRNHTSLKKNALSLLIMQVINYLVPLITLPYLARTLGIVQYGALNLSLSLIQYGVIFITFGFNLSATRDIAKNRGNTQIISKIFWETISSKILLLFFSCIILYYSTEFIDGFNSIRYLTVIFFMQLISVAIDPLWFFQGIERLVKISIITAIIRLINIPLLLFFVHGPHDVEKVAVIQSLLLLLTSIINLYLIKKENILIFIKIKELKIVHSLISSLPLFVGAAAISLYNTSTPLILGLMSNYNEVGIYSAGFKIQMAAVGVFTILGQVIYPRANNLFSKRTQDGYIFVKKLLIYMLPVLSLSLLIFYVMVPPLIVMVLGQDFIGSSEVVKIMSPMLVLVPYSIVLSNNLLLPLGHKHIYYILPIFIGLLHILYTIILSDKFGAIGAAYSMLITEAITLITLITYCYIKTDIKKGYISV